jgi:tight adherence protein B
MRYLFLGLIFITVFLFSFVYYTRFVNWLRNSLGKELTRIKVDLDNMFYEIPLKKIQRRVIYSTLLLFFAGFFITGSIIFGLILGFLGFKLPSIIIRIKKSRRVRKFEGQLVDGLILAANSLRAGFSLYQAFEMMARESAPPLSQDFALLLQEYKMGVSLNEAINNLGKRIPSRELALAITAINIQQETGGNLSETFDQIVKTIRERARLLGQLRTLTAQGKLQGIIVGVLPFILAFVLYLIDPQLIKPMFTTALGKFLIGVVIILEIIGGFLIKKIVAIEV